MVQPPPPPHNKAKDPFKSPVQNQPGPGQNYPHPGSMPAPRGTCPTPNKQQTVKQQPNHKLPG